MVCFKLAGGFDAVVLSILLLAGMPVCGRAWELHKFCDAHALSPTPDLLIWYINLSFMIQ